METTFDLLTLALLRGVSPRAARQLMSRGPLPSVLSQPRDHADLLGPREIEALRTGAARRAAEAEAIAARRLGIEIVGCDDDHYPLWLRRTCTPPPVLWVKGTLVPEEGATSLAVVGSRAASPLGLAFARRLSDELASAGLVVVSGLARGIDSAAHRGCLDAGGRTVAVLGSGLDRIYPPENTGLAAQVEERGAVVSEFPLGTGPLRPHFPRRNRLIAGWSRAVVVVEAGSRSGALSTARAALDEGRDVMAVPGHPSEPQSEGANRLLQDGAALVRGASDVLAELGLAQRPAREAVPDDAVLRAMARDAPAGVDEIQMRCGLALPALLSRLSELELGGAVLRLPGALYVRARSSASYTRPG
jgi:DNA processing protein